jgi:Family of unknown function (DUF6788)
MKHRLHLPQKERFARSKMAKLAHDMPFVIGSLVKMARTCGKATCKCRQGKKHLSWYLALRHRGRRKMICIPKQHEKEVFTWVENYKEIMKQMDIISQEYAERIGQSRARVGE